MANIGSLMVDLRLRTAKFTQGVGKANNRLKTLERSALNARGAITSIVGGAAVTGFALLTKRSLESADAIAKTADKVGFTTSALQELRFAASQTGVSQQKLDASLERFTKRIGEAANGTGAAVKEYERLGISVTDANGQIRRSEDILSEVADKMAAMSTQAERGASMAALMGREAVALTNTFKDGSAGLDEFSRKARDMGLVLDEQLLRNAEKANDEMDVLSRILSTQVSSAVLSLAPQITSLAQAFSEVAQNAGLFFDTLRDNPVSELGKASVIADLNEQIGRLERAKGRNRNAPRLDALKEQRDQLQRALDRQRFGEAPARGVSSAPASIAAPSSSPTASAAAATVAATKAVREHITEAQRLVVQLREEAATLGMTEDQLLRYSAEQAIAAQGGAAHADEIRRLTEQIILERAALEEVEAAVIKTEGQFEESTDQMSTFADQAARNMQDAFADFLFDPFSDGLDGMLDGFLTTIRRMAAEEMAARVFGKSGTGVFGGGVIDESGAFGGGGGGGFGSIITGIGGLFGQNAALSASKSIAAFDPNLLPATMAMGGIVGPGGEIPVNMYARGGVARSPQMAVFGEGSHNEAFVPLPDGRRIPVNMQGGGRSVNITVNTPNAESFRQSRSKIATDISRSLQGAR